MFHFSCFGIDIFINVVLTFISIASAGLHICNWQKEMQVLFSFLATVEWNANSFRAARTSFFSFRNERGIFCLFYGEINGSLLNFNLGKKGENKSWSL